MNGTEAIHSMEQLARLVSESKHCVCFVGAGGKTTLMLRLARLLSAGGKRVVVTTTTHMLRPGIVLPGRRDVYEHTVWTFDEDRSELKVLLEQGCPVIVGRPDPRSECKIIGVESTFFPVLMECADVVLVEADGSRGKPVKVPRECEPVIPRACDLTIAVAGLSALNSPIEEVCFVPDDTALFLQKSMKEELEERDLVKILSSENGCRKSAAGDYLVILNQADRASLREAGERILGKLAEQNIFGFCTVRRERIAVVLLAAGSSRRFGGDKVLAEISPGYPLYLSAMQLAESTDAAACVLVYRHPELRSAARDRRRNWICVENSYPEEGITRSMKLGMAAVESGDMDGWLFMVCDQPNLSPDLLKRMIDVWRSGDGSIVSAAECGRPGNPKIFSSWLGEELLQLTGDVGGRQIVHRYPDELKLVESEIPDELLDADTREILERITKKCRE